MTRKHHATTPRPVELLAPAGGPGPFAAALVGGADAVYCGFTGFNARRKADNFTDETFAAACRSAHLAGARVYVTVNIVIKDEEMPAALELVRRAAILGADAFIIQDWGLFSEIRRLMPELETHVSTQANIHDARGAAWCRDHGADRVTLSRELSLPEIEAIAREGIDVEVFSHGSICFCYSGLCTLSSFAMDGRSANRGMCAQPCRLPYDLVDETGSVIAAPGRERPLCPRDNCTVDMLGALVEAGVASLKLEGRMKAPDYVLSVTGAYREAVDELLAGEGVDDKAAADRKRRLKRCFNRDFTTAYFDGTSGDEMMSYERSNNRGQLVGETVGSRKRNMRADSNGPAPHGGSDGSRRFESLIRLSEPVGAGDLLELRHDDEPEKFLTALAREDAPAGSVIAVSVPRPMPDGCRVRVIRSQRAIDDADAALKRPFPRKRPVVVRVTARLGRPFSVELSCADGSASACVEGFTVEPARTRPVSEQDLVEHVGRMGSAPFEPVSFRVELDEGCGMGFSAVHKVRAAAVEALERELLRAYDERSARLEGMPAFEGAALTASTATPEPDGRAATDPCICALVASADAARAAREAGASRVYADLAAWAAWENDSSLAPKGGAPQSPDDVIPVLDEVAREKDHARLDPWVRPGMPVAVGNVSLLALAEERQAAAEVLGCLPVHNVSCMRALEAAGAAAFWLSPELSLDEIVRIAPHAGAPVGVTVSGRPRVMTSEHCVLMAAGACIDDCRRCRIRRRRCALRNIDDKYLPVRTDLEGRSRIYDAFPLDLTPFTPRLLAAGVSRLMVDATLLSAEETAAAVSRAVRALEAAKRGARPADRARGTSLGRLFEGVD